MLNDWPYCMHVMFRKCYGYMLREQCLSGTLYVAYTLKIYLIWFLYLLSFILFLSRDKGYSTRSLSMFFLSCSTFSMKKSLNNSATSSSSFTVVPSVFIMFHSDSFFFMILGATNDNHPNENSSYFFVRSWDIIDIGKWTPAKSIIIFGSITQASQLWGQLKKWMILYFVPFTCSKQNYWIKIKTISFYFLSTNISESIAERSRASRSFCSDHGRGPGFESRQV